MEKLSTCLLMLFSVIAIGRCELSENHRQNTLANTSTHENQTATLNQRSTDIKNSEHSSDMEEFKSIMLEYVEDVLNREKINIMPGVFIEKLATNDTKDEMEKKSFDENFIWNIKQFIDTHALRVDLARATTETGRLFFFKGK